MRPKLYTPIQKKVIKVEELDDVKTSLITTRRIVFTPSVDVKEEVQGISIQITCLDEDGTVLKQVNSADSGTIEDNENSLTPDPNTVANGDSLPFVGPEPHSLAPLKTPVAPVREGSENANRSRVQEFKNLGQQPIAKVSLPLTSNPKTAILHIIRWQFFCFIFGFSLIYPYLRTQK